MKIKRFKIVSPRDVQSTDNVYETLLLNLDHIISLKPIKMVIEDKVVDGYWIRTTNGKKYRAVEIPKELLIKLWYFSIVKLVLYVSLAQPNESKNDF